MAKLHRASFARGWSEAEIADLLAKPTTLVIITDHGFALIQLIVPEAEVLTIVINPALRGQGHGRALLGQALLAAAKNGARQMFLEVDAGNTAARALYEAAGFTQTGARKNYYTHTDGTRSDAIVMSRALQSSR